MPSQSLVRWREKRIPALDEIESAHRSVGGTRPGRRFATQQINHAYAVLLSSQFQGFCRDLHSECSDYLAQAISPPSLRTTCHNLFVLNRKLDRGNPNPGNLGSDFNRFGLGFWAEVKKLDPRNETRQDQMEVMGEWRNAIAHQDFNPSVLGSTSLQLEQVQRWRRACERLAGSFDKVMRRHIELVTGHPPW
jgi:hypothetical protein